MIQEKEKVRSGRAMAVAVVLALMLALLMLLGLGVWQARRGRAAAGTVFRSLAAKSAQSAGELRGDTRMLSDGAAEAARARLLKLSTSKGRAQRDKHLELLLLVNPWHTLPEGYEPKLAPVTSNWQVTSDFQVDERCADALTRMLNDCLMTGGIPEVCSAYRTLAYQQMLFDNKIERLIDEGVAHEDAPEVAATAVALPGTSEHQLGLAVDILDINYPYLNEYQMFTASQQWLMEHSWEYGFILRYPEGTSDITGIIYEPWHYRYVGEEHAAAIHELGVTLEEYLALRNGR